MKEITVLNEQPSLLSALDENSLPQMDSLVEALIDSVNGEEK